MFPHSTEHFLATFFGALCLAFKCSVGNLSQWMNGIALLYESQNAGVVPSALRRITSSVRRRFSNEFKDKVLTLGVVVLHDDDTTPGLLDAADDGVRVQGFDGEGVDDAHVDPGLRQRVRRFVRLDQRRASPDQRALVRAALPQDLQHQKYNLKYKEQGATISPMPFLSIAVARRSK